MLFSYEDSFQVVAEQRGYEVLRILKKKTVKVTRRSDERHDYDCTVCVFIFLSAKFVKI
jgi:hypothetical protein